MIKASINVVKVNKDKLFPGKNGAKWLNIVLIETPNSEHSDYMVCEDVSKEEREKGIKGAILGNAKIFLKRGQEKPKAPVKPYPEESDEPPF